ncbi:MAG: ABC transporter permease [Acidobacteria bacterium]|nr:ABC transporter permease [Acidobacteriota bacterium]
MDKLLAIIRREYLTRVRSKGFLIGTILTPLFMAGIAFLPMLFFGKGDQRSLRIIVLDQTKDESLYQRSAKFLTENNDRSDRIEVSREGISSENIQARLQALNEEIKADKLGGYILIPSDVLESGKIEQRAKNPNDFALQGRIRNAVKQAIVEERMLRAGISPEKVKEVSKDIHIDFINEQGERETPLAKWILSFAMGIILYISILVYGLYVMRGVMEEKQSRIIEVLLSSVKPFYLMLGKVTGIGLVALTQVSIWVGSMFLISSIAAAQALAFGEFKIPRIPFSMIAFMLIFLVLGYFLYSTLYAMVGAMVSSEEDGQQAQMPITILLVLPYILSSFVLSKPDGLIATILSLVPFFSPILMFMRITVQQPPWWQIALSILLLIGSILGSVWLAAKIYRVGVLMYGKRPSLPELMKWLKYT